MATAGFPFHKPRTRLMPGWIFQRLYFGKTKDSQGLAASRCRAPEVISLRQIFHGTTISRKTQTRKRHFENRSFYPFFFVEFSRGNRTKKPAPPVDAGPRLGMAAELGRKLDDEEDRSVRGLQVEAIGQADAVVLDAGGPCRPPASRLNSILPPRRSGKACLTALAANS